MSFIEKNLIQTNNMYFFLLRFLEHKKYNQNLQHLSIFPQINVKTNSQIKKIILNFSFRDINFNKKKVLAFFFSLEILSNQKPIGTVASRNLLKWKLRKGILVGCKVTLRAKNMFDFFENLILTLPRMEKFQHIEKKDVEKIKTNVFIITLVEIFLFYPIELGLGINFEISNLNINIIFNTSLKEQKIFELATSKIPLTV